MMLANNTSDVSVVPQKQEVESLKQLESILKETSKLKLVDANGDQIPIPESVYQVLCQVVSVFASGQSISIMPQEQEMTTQEAADFLNVSRPYFVKLLEQGEIPHIKVGSHRRVKFLHVKNYKEVRDTERRCLLNELTQESQDMGFYE
jgi:excisionase family DNA binding protein